jgi:hypothetical protein
MVRMAKVKLWHLVLVLLAAGIFVVVVHEKSRPKTFAIITIETTLSWSDGPEVELNAASISKLNVELDKIASRELPGKNIHYPVVSLGKRRVEVMYAGSENLPETTQESLNIYIENRLPKLAEEQALEQVK